MAGEGTGRGAWGAREEASWWPGGEQLQQQALLGHQLAAHQEDAARSTAAATHQLFSYKMASSFQQPPASPPAAYDYRLGMGGLARAAPGDPPHWWYSAGVDALHQAPLALHSTPSPTHQQQNQQNQQHPSQNSQQQAQQSQQNQQQQQLQQQSQQSLQQQLQSAQQQLQSAQQQQLQSQQQQLQSQQQQQLQSQQQQLQSQQQQQQLQSQQQQLQSQQQQLQNQGLQQLGQGQVLQVPQAPKPRMPRGRGGDSKPRGRMTAYACFVQTCREEHKKKHPEENVIFAAFSKKCAERWKTMLDKEKQRFHEMAERDKKRYDLEMQSYVPPKGEKVGRGRKRKQIKDPNAPKRSLSAFFWFSNDERSKVKAINPEYGVGDIAKELGRRWADCDPETKSKYEAMSEKDKARYDREMTAYKKKPKPVVPAPEEEEEDEADDDEFE